MAEIEADRRRIEMEPDFACHERAKVLARQFVESQVVLARELVRIALTRTFVALDCASIEEYGVRLGLTPHDARSLVDLGRALDLPSGAGEPSTGCATGTPPPANGEDALAARGNSPTVADAVLAGAMSVPQATLAGRLISKPELLHEGENAVAIATSQPARRVHALIREREEEAAQQQAVTSLALAVSLPARENFGRARAVASEQAGTMLTEGETFALVVNHYLDDFDPLRQGEGERRLPDTAELPGRRYIPADARRQVRARSGDRCEVPACGRNVFLEFAHIRPHRAGGSREAADLLRLCHGHHVLLDAGRIRFDGWDDDRPCFRDAGGRRLSERADLVPPTADAPKGPTGQGGGVNLRESRAAASDPIDGAVVGAVVGAVDGSVDGAVDGSVDGSVDSARAEHDTEPCHRASDHPDRAAWDPPDRAGPGESCVRERPPPYGSDAARTGCERRRERGPFEAPRRADLSHDGGPSIAHRAAVPVGRWRTSAPDSTSTSSTSTSYGRSRAGAGSWAWASQDRHELQRRRLTTCETAITTPISGKSQLRLPVWPWLA